MDTKRSGAILAKFQGRDFVARRKVQRYERDFPVSPAELFPLLCPTLEADWIPGWSADLVYTTTGYAEPDCVFKTDGDNPVGAGTWIIHDHVPDERLEVVMVAPELVLNLRVALSPTVDGGTQGRWTLTTTSLTPKTNELVEEMPDRDPRFAALLDGLEHYLATGRMAVAPPGGRSVAAPA